MCLIREISRTDGSGGEHRTAQVGGCRRGFLVWEGALHCTAFDAA